jgi:hypothetical protein
MNNMIDLKYRMWRCHCCGNMRSNRFINVISHDVSYLNNGLRGTMYFNCRYCNDKKECMEMAANKEVVLSKFATKKSIEKRLEDDDNIKI